MTALRMIVFPVLLATSAVSANHHCMPTTEAVSKEVYDYIQHADSLGVDVQSVDPDTLEFESKSFDDCLDQAKSRYKDKDVIAVAVVKCGSRHESFGARVPEDSSAT